MLGDFFRINMPYGICRNENNEWYAFNREYVPIGFNNTDYATKFRKMDLPIYTAYKGLTEKKLLEIAWHPTNGVKRDENNQIFQVMLYNDGLNPMNQGGKDVPLLWENYFKKLKLLSKLKQKEYA